MDLLPQCPGGTLTLVEHGPHIVTHSVSGQRLVLLVGSSAAVVAAIDGGYGEARKRGLSVNTDKGPPSIWTVLYCSVGRTNCSFRSLFQTSSSFASPFLHPLFS